MLIVKKIRQILIIYNIWTLRHAMTKKMTPFPKSWYTAFSFSGLMLKTISTRCLVNKVVQNLTGQKRRVLVENLTPFDETLR